MTILSELKAVQLDALREVANIGAGHAATALSQMTDRRILISVPEVISIQHDDLSQRLALPDGQQTVVVATSIMGDLTGKTALTLGTGDAQRLCNCLLRRESTPEGQLDSTNESTLKEVGNILAGAYLNALATFMGMMLLPSVPELVTADAWTFLGANDVEDKDIVLCAATEFSFLEGESGHPLRSNFLHFPDKASLQAIFQAINIG